MASADGAGRRREQVTGQIGRTAPVGRLGVPVPAAGPGGSRGPGQWASGVPGMVVRAPGLDNLGTGPSPRCAHCRWRVRAVGGDAVVMAEQAIVGFAGLLRQLRAEARLTQQELAKAAGVSPRSVSDLERGINRTARQDTAVRLAGALGLAEPARSLFVAAALGRIPAAQVLAARRRQAPGESPASAGGMHGFVPALTSFVGRAGPVREVAGLLDRDRLVTVTGPGGTGKTRLAAEVARQVAGRFADGAWLVELAPVADPAQVAAVVAAALGVREQPGVPAAEAVARVLARQQLLLVLDNCEHVIGAAAELCAGLLAACDDVRVLATSREPLRVAGEAGYRLAPLALPDPADLAEAARAEAVALFTDRARSADARFALTGETTPMVARLVARLDGMPLAIELAAARVEALGVAQLLDRLDDRFALLAGGRPERRRRGSGRWPPRWSGATSCSMSTSGGCSARCRCSRARSRWRRPRRSPGRRGAGGAAAGGLLAADPAAAGPGWPVPLCDAGDAARLRGRAAGRDRGAGGDRRRAGRVRAAGGPAGRGRVAVR